MSETGYAETVGIAENAEIWAGAVPDVVVEGWEPTPVAGQRALDLSPGVGIAAFQRSETITVERVVAPTMEPGALGQWFALTRHRRWLEGSGATAGESAFRLVPAGTTTAATPKAPPVDFESWLRDEGGATRENLPGVEYDQLLDWYWWAQASTVPTRFPARRLADSALPGGGAGGREILIRDVPWGPGDAHSGTFAVAASAGLVQVTIPDPGCDFEVVIRAGFAAGVTDPAQRLDFAIGYGGATFDGPLEREIVVVPTMGETGLHWRPIASARTGRLSGALTWRLIARRVGGGSADGIIESTARYLQIQYVTPRT